MSRRWLSLALVGLGLVPLLVLLFRSTGHLDLDLHLDVLDDLREQGWSIVDKLPTPFARKEEPRVARVTLSFGDDIDDLSRRMLDLQQTYSAKFGYRHRVLHRQLLPSYWSKPAWLLSIALEELEKAPEERLQWLMCALPCWRHHCHPACPGNTLIAAAPQVLRL